MLKDASKEVRTRNERHLCAVYYDKEPSYQKLTGLLNEVMKKLDVPFQSEGGNSGYHLRKIEGLSIFFITPFECNFTIIFLCVQILCSTRLRKSSAKEPVSESWEVYILKLLQISN